MKTFPSPRAPTIHLKTDNPSDPLDKMLVRVLFNQLQSKYAMLVNAGKMSKKAQFFLLQRVHSASSSNLAGVPGRSSPHSNLVLMNSHQMEEQGTGGSASGSHPGAELKDNVSSVREETSIPSAKTSLALSY